MSIRSKVKSAASKVKSAIKKTVNAISKALSGKSSSSLASVGSLSTPKSSTNQTPNNNQTYNANISTNYGPGQVQKGGSVVLLSGQGQPTGGVISSSGVGQTQAPRRISSRGGASSGGGSNPLANSPIYPVTIGGGSNRATSSDSFGGMSLLSSPSSFNTIGTQSYTSQNQIALPSRPAVANPGQINNGGLISALAEMSQYDPNTNSFLPKELDAGNTEGRMEIEKMLQDLIPERESASEDREVQRQQQEVNARKQEVANYTAQLNSVIAQQNADLLRLREIGSQEGVTETVYGGQQATINREAAIKALPIQAQIAAAQGNLELAQDYLTQLTTWKQEQLDNDYSYKKEVYNSIRNFVDREESLQLKKMEREDDRTYREAQDNIAEQDYWIRQAVSNGQTSLITRINAINPASPTFRQELGNVVGALAKSTSSTSTGGGDKPLSISQIEQFRRSYGWTPPFGYTQAQLLQFMEDNPGASPEELESAANRISSGNETPTQESITLDKEYFKSNFSTDQLKQMADKAGVSKWYTPKGMDINRFLDQIAPKIETARAEGYTDQEILEFLMP